MGSMLELEKTVEEIKSELEIQKHTCHLVFTMVIETINELSPQHNVREVMTKILNETDRELYATVPGIEETLKRVERIISKS